MYGCSTGNDLKDLYAEWQDKKFVIPQRPIWTIMAKDTIEYSSEGRICIINYIDSTGCVSCKSQLPAWQEFFSNVEAITGGVINTMTFICPKRLSEAKLALRDHHFTYPVCIDLADSLNKLNHFPADERFHCFLLDENNRVLLIGNPVQNPKIKELYIRTICERLGIEQPTSSDGKPDNIRNLGNFPYTETKETEFQLRNNSEGTVNIDTVYTSCSCTTASLNKTTIEPGGFAQLKVRYQADAPGTFMREVYVGFGGQTITFTIRGEAME